MPIDRNNISSEYGASFSQSNRPPTAGENAFWDMQALKSAPQVEVVSETVESSSAGDIVVKELKYESPASGGEMIKIFAYYACPKSRQGTKIPAVVWVHGGASVGNRAAAVDWASKGYAAISMDLPGKGGPYRETSRSEGIDMTDEHIFNVAPSPKESYLYTCVNAVCRAISLLENDEQADASRIGVLGFSWGGVITLITNGIDDRVSAACSVFGAGFITEESTWVEGQLKKLSAEQARIWRDHFDPSIYMRSQNGKTLFVCATQDIYYPLRSFLKTYRLATCEKAMGLVVNRNHELDDVNSGNIVRWFDYALGNGSPFPTLSVTSEGEKLRVEATGSQPIAEVRLFTTDSTDFAQAVWTGVELKDENGAWSGQAPADDTPYFIAATDESGVVVVDDVHLPGLAVKDVADD